MSDNPPGWYRDPSEPTTQRYWDGEGWLGESLPIDATPPEGPLLAPTSPGWPAPPAPYPGYPGWPPFTAPPGSTPPGSASPGHVPPGHVPPGHVPPGHVPPGHVPPGHVPPGHVPPGHVPPGQVPPEAYRPGSLPPGGPFPYRPGPLPPGQLPPGIPPDRLPPGAVIFPIPLGPDPLHPRPYGYALASLGSRFVARLVDILAVAVVAGVLNSYLIYQFIRETSPYWSAFRKALATGSTGSIPNMSSHGQNLLLVIIIVAMVSWAVYEVPATARWGQTLGKKLLGIKVIGLDGKTELGGRRALRRWLPLGAPMLAWTCCIGFLIQLVDCGMPLINRPLRLALHDVYAATVVVSTHDVQEPEMTPPFMGGPPLGGPPTGGPTIGGPT